MIGSAPWSKSLTSFTAQSIKSLCLQPNSSKVLQELGGRIFLLPSQLAIV
jgi:hypothetical protein